MGNTIYLLTHNSRNQLTEYSGSGLKVGSVWLAGVDYRPITNYIVTLCLPIHLVLLLAQAACVRHACLRAPCVAWPLFSPLFSLSFFLSSPPSSAFDPLRRISHVRNNFGPGGLRAPCVLACAMRSLAIVFTNFRSSFSPLFFPPSSAFDPLRGISHVRNNFSPNILA